MSAIAVHELLLPTHCNRLKLPGLCLLCNDCYRPGCDMASWFALKAVIRNGDAGICSMTVLSELLTLVFSCRPMEGGKSALQASERSSIFIVRC